VGNQTKKPPGINVSSHFSLSEVPELAGWCLSSVRPVAKKLRQPHRILVLSFLPSPFPILPLSFLFAPHLAYPEFPLVSFYLFPPLPISLPSTLYSKSIEEGRWYAKEVDEDVHSLAEAEVDEAVLDSAEADQGGRSEAVPT